MGSIFGETVKDIHDFKKMIFSEDSSANQVFSKPKRWHGTEAKKKI
jgi:hypothetical protein